MEESELVIIEPVTQDQLEQLTPAEREGLEQVEIVTDVPRLMQLLKERQQAYARAEAEVKEASKTLREATDLLDRVEDDLRNAERFLLDAIKAEAMGEL